MVVHTGNSIVRPLRLGYPRGATEAGLDSIVVGSKSLYAVCISALTFHRVF